MTERAICRYEGCNNLVDLPHPYCRTHRDIVALEKLGISPSDVPPAKCQYPDCSNNAVKRSPGRYKKYCSQHLKHKEPCWICGWAEASCDSHRVWPGKYGGLYEVNNITNLCPNHHRLCHHDFGKFCREIASRFKDDTLFNRKLIELMRSSRAKFEIKFPGVSYFEEMKKSGHAKIKSRH